MAQSSHVPSANSTAAQPASNNVEGQTSGALGAGSAAQPATLSLKKLANEVWNLGPVLPLLLNMMSLDVRMQVRCTRRFEKQRITDNVFLEQIL